MAFEFFTWLLTFSLNRAGNRTLESLSKGSLARRLRDELRNWADELPGSQYAAPEALFPKSLNDVDPTNRPALANLYQNFNDNHAPTDEAWQQRVI